MDDNEKDLKKIVETVRVLAWAGLIMTLLVFLVSISTGSHG